MKTKGKEPLVDYSKSLIVTSNECANIYTNRLWTNKHMKKSKNKRGRKGGIKGLSNKGDQDKGFKCKQDNKDKAMHWKRGGGHSTKHNAL